MSDMVTKTFVVAHSAVKQYRTRVEMAVPAAISDDPNAIHAWLNTAEAQSQNYLWTDAFDPKDDCVNTDSAEIDGVDFDID